MRRLVASLVIGLVAATAARASDEDARGLQCPGAELLRKAFQNDIGRFCDAQWRLTRNPDVKTEPRFVNLCEQRCHPATLAKFTVPSAAPLLGVVTLTSVVSIASKGPGTPASP